MATDTPPPPDEAPDWDAIDFDVTCVRCGYNLKLLAQPRCPECGLEFEWAQVVTYHRQSSDFLFEHQWRRRPMRSLITTFVQAFRPRAFWNQVSMFERVRTGPLTVLILLAVVLFLVVLHVFAWLIGRSILLITGPPLPAQMYLQPDPLIWLAQSMLDLAEAPFKMRGGAYLWFPASVLCAIVGAFGLVLLLGDTLGRCRVRRVQVLRVFAYAALPAAILQPLVVLAVNVVGSLLGSDGPVNDSLPVVLLGICASLVVVVGAFGAYLSLGFKHYLRSPRPWLVGMTAAFVGVLATAACAAVSQFRP
ncbi:MAG: hypothetical protein IT450_13930 [Phycisphaerales bacterium]|nr:hypothetical protein [Phycisphaerales bacterium]